MAVNGHSAARHQNAIANVATKPVTQYPTAMAVKPTRSSSQPAASKPTGSL